MDNILNKIIKIEHEAQRIADEAVAAKAGLADEIEVKRADFALKIDAETDAEIEKYREKEQNAAARREAEQHQKHQKNMLSLKEVFDKHSKKWEKEIFDSIIGK